MPRASRSLSVLLAAATAGASAAVAALVLRERARRRHERAVAARLPLGPDGVVRGAEARTYAGGGDRAVLLLHGFGDTPQSVDGLARHLQAAGWTVRVPLLPGHGRTLPAFAASGAADWLACARAELATLRARHGTVALVGQSMGGALAATLAAESPDVAAVVLLAPYVAMPAAVRAVARLHGVLGMALPYLGSNGGARSIHDAEARAAALGYGVVTPRLLRELSEIVDLAIGGLPRVRAATRVVLSRQDNRVAPVVAERVLARVPRCDLVWLDGCGHVIAADRERERVFALTAEWLAAPGVRGAAAALAGCDDEVIAAATGGRASAGASSGTSERSSARPRPDGARARG